MKNNYYIIIECFAVIGIFVISHYGYDHSHNNGISEFSDAYDFYPERIDFTEEHLNTVIEYFKTRKLEFYAEYMAGVPFFKSDRDG